MAKAQTIVKLTAETNDYEKKMRQAQKTFNDFMKGVGMSPTKFSALTLAIGATTAAMKVAKDAFFKNESQLDEWNRQVESSKSVYSGFLNALNNGDISGFLSNMDTIVKAARAAYDALDELATFNAFNQINVERTRTGMTESIADFREGKGTKEAVKAAGEAYKKELKDRQRLEKEAYLESVRKIAAERGVSGNDLIDALGGSYGHYQDLKKVMPTGVRMVSYSGGMFGGGGAYKEAYAQTRQEQLGQALRQLNDTELQSLQALGAQAERTGNEIASVDKQLTRVINGRGAGGSGGGGVSGGGRGGRGGVNNEVTYAADSIAAQEALVSELTKKWKEAGAAVRNDYLKQLNEAQWKLEDMKNPQSRPMLAAPSNMMEALAGKGVEEKVTVPQEALEKIADGLAKAMAGPEGTPLNEVMSSMASGMSQVVNGMEQLGIDIPDGIKSAIGAIQGISTILTGISTTLIAIETLSAADTLIPFARGGIIPRAAGGYFVGGRNFSSDITPIMANAGELVLNRAQQGVLAQQLSNNHLSNMHLSASLTGETITLAVNAHNRRVGRGEVATTRNRRYGNMDS